MEQYRLLEGVKVVELSTMIAATSCGRTLAEWGADVIKVESPAGDNYRNFATQMSVPCTEDENPLFDVVNAHKKSVVIHLKSDEGIANMHRLLADADVFLTNVRPQALARLGLDYETLKEKYPRLIYAAISGYGEKGPRADSPGYDTIAFWAATGFLGDMRVDSGENSYPVSGPAGPGDVVTGMALLSVILAALYKRTLTNKGDYVTASLYGTALWCFHVMLVSTEERYGNIYPKTRLGSNPLASPFRTSDDDWIMTTILNFPKDWPKICQVLGVEELTEDPRFSTAKAQRSPESREYLMNRFAGIFAGKTAAEWCELLTKADIVHDRLAKFKDMEQSEQAWANEFIHEEVCPNGNKTVLVRPAMFSQKNGITPFTRGPKLGEHNEEILGSNNRGEV